MEKDRLLMKDGLYLTAVRRVGERLSVSNHTSGKDDLTIY